MEQEPSELVAQLGSVEWRRRERAYHGLREMGNDAVPALLEGARHTDWRVRATSVALMDHLAAERCVEVLCEAVKDDSLHVRRHAAHALACQGCKPKPLDLDVLGILLGLATKDPSIQVRRVATAKLVLQRPSRCAAKRLKDMLRSETDEKLLRRVWLALKHHASAA